MAELINLNRARKAKARAETQADAAANRAKHGRTKGEKLNAETAQARAKRALDQARREP